MYLWDRISRRHFTCRRIDPTCHHAEVLSGFNRFNIISLLIGVLALLPPVSAKAQPAAVSWREEVYNFHTGVHQGTGNTTRCAVSRTVSSPGAPWLRLHFGECSLGRHSFLTITSLQDGQRQHFNNRTIEQWFHATAFFTGDAVQLELHVGPDDKDIFVNLVKMTVGEPADSSSKTKDAIDSAEASRSLCGDDDRVASTDARVGRIMPVGCTGWIVSNGAHLTAGHCTDGSGNNMQILEFDVPASLPNGTTSPAPIRHQYPIDPSSINFFNDGPGDVMGDDWAVFACNVNSETQLLPVQAQRDFFRMSRDDDPSRVRITGYGIDDTPPGTNGPAAPCCRWDGTTCTSRDCNSDSQTEQTESGNFMGETVEGDSDVIIEYGVDTEPASSGSPVIIDGTDVTVGIHTNGGCSEPFDGNRGTGFEHDDLEHAIETFLGPVVTYVDPGHPHAKTLGDGSVFRPFDEFGKGVATVPERGTLAIMSGQYTVDMTISKAVTLVAPVGAVVLGQ